MLTVLVSALPVQLLSNYIELSFYLIDLIVFIKKCFLPVSRVVALFFGSDSISKHSINIIMFCHLPLGKTGTLWISSLFLEYYYKKN